VCQLFGHEFWHGREKRFSMDFGRFWLAFGRLFGSLFRPKRESEKVCLDCTGVCGLHIQLSGKYTFPQLFPSFFFRSPAREAILIGFWCFWDSLGAPWVTILEAGGDFWGDRKRGRKKDRDRERKGAPRGTEKRTARGRRKSKRWQASQESACCLVSHAPCPCLAALSNGRADSMRCAQSAGPLFKSAVQCKSPQ